MAEPSVILGNDCGTTTPGGGIIRSLIYLTSLLFYFEITDSGKAPRDWRLDDAYTTLCLPDIIPITNFSGQRTE